MNKEYYGNHLEDVLKRIKDAVPAALHTNTFSTDAFSKKLSFKETDTDDDYLIYLLSEANATIRSIKNLKDIGSSWESLDALKEFCRAVEERLSPAAKEKYNIENTARVAEEKKRKLEQERNELSEKIEKFCKDYATKLRAKNFKGALEQLTNARQGFRDNSEMSKYKKGLFGLKYNGDYLSFDEKPMIERMKKENKL